MTKISLVFPLRQDDSAKFLHVKKKLTKSFWSFSPGNACSVIFFYVQNFAYLLKKGFKK
jgi:hypothetical protein